VVVVLATIAGLLWMLWSMRTQPEYFSGESMRLGLSITDDDQVVRVDMDGIEHGGLGQGGLGQGGPGHGGLGHGAQPPDSGADPPPDPGAEPPPDPGGWR
jgi:hypothetical protein